MAHCQVSNENNQPIACKPRPETAIVADGITPLIGVKKVIIERGFREALKKSLDPRN